MSLRDEENKKQNCPSRGVGIPTEAIGVGLGATLYYFFCEITEYPSVEGSTSQGWHCQQCLTLSEEERLIIIRDQAFRERSWSLEKCSICFEMMFKNQELMSLPCTHIFHVRCIGLWLKEQQTCPNCRKTAE